MTTPSLTVRVDWDNDNDFVGSIDDVTADLVTSKGVRWERGRSADFSAEATGAASFVLDNEDGAYTPDRNWHDNGSWEDGTSGWSILAIASLTAAATSITQVTDNAPSAGTKAGEAVLTATLNSGVTYPIPYRFRSGLTYAVSVYLKSMSGNLNVRAGLASSGTPTDIASSGANITTSWAAYTFTWTPSADRADAVFFVRTTTAAVATLRIDAGQVNPGATANAYLEAPTKGQLVPGRPVHIFSTYSAVDYPHFYGYIERLSPNPVDRTVAITCYDVLTEMGNRSVTVPVGDGLTRSAREIRRYVLDEFERGNRNLAAANPSFETDTTGWTTTGATLARITTDAAVGTACGQITLDNAATNEGVQFRIRTLDTFPVATLYRASIYVKLVSGAADYNLLLYGLSGGAYLGRLAITATTTWTRYTVAGAMDSTVSGAGTTPLRVNFRSASQHAGVVLVDGLQVTVGAAYHPYTDLGAGRWKNLINNDDFEGGSTSGWTDAWANLCTNGNFESGTAGWDITADAFTLNAANSFSSSSAQFKFGAKSGLAVMTVAQTSGVWFALGGTFLAGVAYRVTFQVRSGTTNWSRIGIGSNGTPTDYAANESASGASWASRNVTWTPSADRTDVHLFASSAGDGNAYIDGVMVTRGATGYPPYADTGPNGGGSLATTITAGLTNPNTGLYALAVTTAATAGSGVIYDLSSGLASVGAAFPPIAFTLSLYIRCNTGTAAVKIGISVNKLDGTFDETSTTPTVTTTHQRVTLTWTPSVEWLANQSQQFLLTVWQTDAVARTLYIDSVRLEPGSSATDYELARWSLPNGGESGASNALVPIAVASGTVSSLLSTLNGVMGSRHYIRPAQASPWYTYVAVDRSTARASAETFDDDFIGMTVADLDRASIRNVQRVVTGTVSGYYSDSASVGAYGVRPSTDVSATAWEATQEMVDAVGAALVARYKDPRARPAITVFNRFPSQLQRELDDLITVNYGRLRINGGKYLILRSTTITTGSLWWTTTYVLEEYAS